MNLMLVRRASQQGKSATLVALACILSSCSSTSTYPSAFQPPRDSSSNAARFQSQTTPVTDNATYACNEPPTRGMARCLAIVRTDLSSGDALISGFHPADIQTAYNLPSSTNGSGQTVAIISAADDPKLESDLRVYRRTFELEPCTTKNGCFRKLNQQGQPGPYPSPDPSWAAEESLDVDMVSAVCPKCHIVVVEASNGDATTLGKAVDEAVKLGANTVSNSYTIIGEPATFSVPGYNHRGVVITASSGDGGYESCPYQCVAFPASSPHVVAVGGTTLIRTSSTRGWDETAWAGSGSGCSGLSKPSWQHDTGCNFRTVADVAAVADPETGVAIYDTYWYRPRGWKVAGGTSASSPLVAAIYALAGNEKRVDGAHSLYQHTSDLYDITQGSNGSCDPPYLCNAEPGYDGPTGNGSPNGILAF